MEMRKAIYNETKFSRPLIDAIGGRIINEQFVSEVKYEMDRDARAKRPQIIIIIIGLYHYLCMQSFIKISFVIPEWHF